MRGWGGVEHRHGLGERGQQFLQGFRARLLANRGCHPSEFLVELRIPSLRRKAQPADEQAQHILDFGRLRLVSGELAQRLAVFHAPGALVLTHVVPRAVPLNNGESFGSAASRLTVYS